MDQDPGACTALVFCRDRFFLFCAIIWQQYDGVAELRFSVPWIVVVALSCLWVRL